MHCSILGLPCSSAGKESTCNEEDLGLIPGLGRSPGEGKDYPLMYSGLENSMDHMGLQRVGHYRETELNECLEQMVIVSQIQALRKWNDF